MIASRSSVLNLALTAALVVPGVFVSGSAIAQTYSDIDLCADNGALMQGARAAQAARAQEIEEHARNVYGPMAQSPDFISNANSPLANCVADRFEGWQSSTGNGLFDRVANAAIERAIDQACAEQRRRVSEYTSQATGYLSRIPGYENVGSVAGRLPTGNGTGLSYDDLIRRIGGGNNIPSIPTVPTNPGGNSGVPGVGNPGVPGVGNPRPRDPNPGGGGGVPGVTP